MNSFIGKIKDWLNLGTIPLIGLLGFTSLLLFLPNAWLSKIMILDIRNSYGVYIGTTFVFSVSFLVATALNKLWAIWFGPMLKESINIWYYKRDAKNLTKDEKEVLRRFIENGTRSTSLSIQDATVLGLQQRNIIIRVGSIGISGGGFYFPFNIQPWAWKFFNNNKELLD